MNINSHTNYVRKTAATFEPIKPEQKTTSPFSKEELTRLNKNMLSILNNLKSNIKEEKTVNDIKTTIDYKAKQFDKTLNKLAAIASSVACTSFGLAFLAFPTTPLLCASLVGISTTSGLMALITQASRPKFAEINQQAGVDQSKINSEYENKVMAFSDKFSKFLEKCIDYKPGSKQYDLYLDIEKDVIEKEMLDLQLEAPFKYRVDLELPIEVRG